MSESHDGPSNEVLRSLLEAAFNHEELAKLCFDRFHDLYEDMKGWTRDQGARELISYCKRQGRVADLLVAVKERNPIQYDRYFPLISGQYPPQESVEQRLATIEAILGDPGRYVTQEQASMISQAVKTVALALGKKTGRNEFGSVYGELFRKFRITSYKVLPARQFEEAMKFLGGWHEAIAE